MALPYERKFNIGRQSDLLLNEELDKLYEALKHLEDEPTGKQVTPEAKVNGALWIDKQTNQLMVYDADLRKWKPLFEDKFRIFDQMTTELTPANPIKGQLWMYNDVLMYYNGAGWKPVYTLERSDSQFNISSFGDYDVISPLSKVGSTVVDDNEIDAYIEEERKYIEGKLSYGNDASVLTSGKYKPETHECNEDVPILKDLKLKGSTQYLVPNASIDRVFIDDKLDDQYEIKNKTCITYPKDYLIRKDANGRTVRKTPSLIHQNPGKISSITKRLVKIDKTNPKIGISAVHTEFYGFTKGDPFGHFLMPRNDGAEGGLTANENGYYTFDPNDESRVGDYQILTNCIYLSRNAAENYDYVLAVTFDFSWVKATGQLRQATNVSNSTSYYIPTSFSPLDVFVQGYNLEEPYFRTDPLNRILTIDDNTSQMEISLLHSSQHEYGFVTKVDLEGRAIIHPYHKYKQPLVFMNGEALHPMLADVEIDEETNTVYVGGGQVDMCWSIIELEGEDGFCMYQDSGLVTQTYTSPDGKLKEPAIVYNVDDMPDKAYGKPADIVVFVDGLLIKKDDVQVTFGSGKNRYIRIQGLQMGQEYILLYDRDQNFYGDLNVNEATAVGAFNESLVYDNGLLLCNDTAFVQRTNGPDALVASAANGEVKQFLNNSYYDEHGKYVVVSHFMKFNSALQRWEEDVDHEIENDLVGYTDSDGKQHKGIANSYSNAVTAISYTNGIVKKEDKIRIYCFNYASATDSPLVIGSIDANNEREFPILDKKSYIVGTNSLSVWVNGVRQYEVEEQVGGQTFVLPEPVTGLVTYVIQKPEKGELTTAKRIVLSEKNVVKGCANIYTTKDLEVEDAGKDPEKKTDISLYPGRVALYIDGIRQPKEAYTIIDNYTFYINDSNTVLVGAESNYPVAKTFDTHNEMHELNYDVNDRIWTKNIEWADKPVKENGLVNKDLVDQIQEPVTESQKEEWLPMEQPTPLHIEPSRIMVEVKYDYDRTENTFQPDPNAKYTINLDYYGLPLPILDTSDEILIFLDGLFFGLRNEEGYHKDKLSGALILKDQAIVNSIIGDPLEDYLMAHFMDAKSDNPNYIYEEQLKEYRAKQPARQHTITLEWR